MEKDYALGFFENKLGGRIAVYPAADDLGDGFFTHHRVTLFKDTFARLDSALPRIDCHSYTLLVAKQGADKERYYFVANLSTDTAKEIKINGKVLECNLNTYGIAVFCEKDGEIISVI